MAEKTARQKLEILLNHWVEHNQAHIQQFEKWAEKAQGLGMSETCREIMSAARQLEEVSKYLIEAREKMCP